MPEVRGPVWPFSARLVQGDRRATGIQITTRYNQGMVRPSLNNCEADGLLSAKNRKRRLQFSQAHQSGTIED